jgi:hypothetical protein
VLDRIALHQTRLHTPGLGLDAKGIALGAKGLVLLPSIDRLVAFLAVYTRERSLEDIVPSLAMHVVRSKLGTREITLEVAAESSDRMDRLAETARLVGGFTFTGTARHFVQYRDAAAPFGYDAVELLATEAAVALYHDRFSQTYDVDREIDLRALLLRLMPRVDPATKQEPGLRYVVAEHGLGAALVHYFVRSRVEGEVCVAEWPPESAFDDAPVRRWLIRIPELPPRMQGLMHETPGIASFVPAGGGIAVEAGYRHPVELRACPVFDPAGLVLVRGGGKEPLTIDRLPPMGALRSFARVEVRTAGREEARAGNALEPDVVRVPLQLVPSTGAWRNVTATWIAPAQIPLLRRLAYVLPRATIATTRIAITRKGAILRAPKGVEAIPLGTFFVELHENVYIPAGYEVTPAVAPDVLARALGAPASQVLFVGADGRAAALDEGAFAPLEAMLLEAPPWEPVVADEIDHALEEPAVELAVTPIGMIPTQGVRPPEA